MIIYTHVHRFCIENNMILKIDSSSDQDSSKIFPLNQNPKGWIFSLFCIVKCIFSAKESIFRLNAFISSEQLWKMCMAKTKLLSFLCTIVLNYLLFVFSVSRVQKLKWIKSFFKGQNDSFAMTNILSGNSEGYFFLSHGNR